MRAIALFLLLAIPGIAAEPAPGAAHRFPQPVRAGALIGRDLLAPIEAQPVLGRVQGVERRDESGYALLVRTRSLLPWGGRIVQVPTEDVALLGDFVVLVGITPAQLEALPQARPGSPVPPEQSIQIGLARPFH